MRKVFMGVRLRALREQRQLTQAEMARQLDISPSYLNQIENNERPLTVSVLLRLQSRMAVDPQFFSEDDEARLMVQLREITLDSATEVPTAELQALVRQMPAMAEMIIRLHRRCRDAEEHVQDLAAATDEDNPLSRVAVQQPHEEVRDYFHSHHNHIAVLDERAEALYGALQREAGLGEQERLSPHVLVEQLHRLLRSEHDVAVRLRDDPQRIRHFDPRARLLSVSSRLEPGQQAFQLATQLAWLDSGEQITELTEAADLGTDTARRLAGMGLASYFAGALVLPYGLFYHSAEAQAYDIELLAEQFGVSYETVCHRLSTLQRPEARGVPFFLVRVDRAGNISKRQSATDFHFSRTGGSCPLWNVYEAFARPDKIHTQLARMPDGRTHLWVARAISRRWGGHLGSERRFAIALGCDLHHAERLVYAKGLNLRDADAATPIGTGCKVCDRTDCDQRAFPAIGRPLKVDPLQRVRQPYPLEG